MLGIAAREADIVNINYNLQEGRINRKMVRTGMASATDEKLGWIKEAAGDRIDALELSVTIFVATVTDDRDSIAEAMGSGLDMESDEVLAIPHFLIGTVDQIVDDLRVRRERYGISYVIVPGEVAEQMAPIVERLAGS